jgi:hypothetical protein
MLWLAIQKGQSALIGQSQTNDRVADEAADCCPTTNVGFPVMEGLVAV